MSPLPQIDPGEARLGCRACAFRSIASVMSIPMARPRGPTAFAARRRSVPEPQPMSTTVAPAAIGSMRRGFPTPANDSTANGGMRASSSGSYRRSRSAYSRPRWKWNSPSGAEATLA